MTGERIGDQGPLVMAASDLAAAFAATAEVWMDDARLDFERTRLEPLLERVRDAAVAMDALHHLLAEARRTCS